METLEYMGQTIEFEPFKEEDSHLIKIVIDPQGDGQFCEGIWANIRPADWDKYNNPQDNTSLIVCMLRNDSIHGMPYGSYLIAQCRGDKRPVCNLGL